MREPCMCGAIDCSSCGSAQGYNRCKVHNIMACEKCLERENSYNTPEKSGPMGEFCQKHLSEELFFYDGELVCFMCEDEEALKSITKFPKM